MSKLILTLAVLSAGVWGYLIGSLIPATRDTTTTERDAIAYMVANDRGCNDIIMHEDGKFVCEVDMESEDDAVFVVKLIGAKDNYEK